MALSQYKEIGSDEDDDLPSLADRIKSASKLQLLSNKTQVSTRVATYPNAFSESENEDEEFLKFSEMIYKTPYSQVKPPRLLENKVEESKLLKSAEKSSVSQLCMKLNFSETSDSEDEESVLLNSSAKIQNTPQPQFILFSEEESSGDEELFENIIQRMCTPKAETREDHLKTDESDSDKSLSNCAEKLFTPLPINRENHHKSDESDTDESFSDFIEKLHTPLPIKKGINSTINELNGDGSFLKSAEKFQVFHTPMSKKKNNCRANNSDSEDSFLETSLKFRAFHTPKSQIKVHRKDAILSPQIVEKKKTSRDPPESPKVRMSENEKEFNTLFPSIVVKRNFIQDRTKYTQKLFAFYNRKVFDSKLPQDMPLIWDGALVRTAGITHCSMKNNVYTCAIKLSSELLCTFDRLMNTLLHEMCHAAVWILNKQRNVHHGPIWQIWASRCKLILPFIECITRCHTYEVSYRVWYRCTTCNWKKGRCKQVKKYHGAVCSKCKTPITMTYN